MTEVLGKVQDTEPSEQNFEGEPSLEAQKEFFRQALREGAEIGDRPRLLKGSYYAGFESIIRLSDEAIKAIDPQLTPEYSMPMSYMPVDVMIKIQCTSKLRASEAGAHPYESSGYLTRICTRQNH
jgi:hypothetical protein